MRTEELLEYIEEKEKREQDDEIRNEASFKEVTLINLTSVLRKDIVNNIDVSCPKLGTSF